MDKQTFLTDVYGKIIRNKLLDTLDEPTKKIKQQVYEWVVNGEISENDAEECIVKLENKKDPSPIDIKETKQEFMVRKRIEDKLKRLQDKSFAISADLSPYVNYLQEAIFKEKRLDEGDIDHLFTRLETVQKGESNSISLEKFEKVIDKLVVEKRLVLACPELSKGNNIQEYAETLTSLNIDDLIIERFLVQSHSNHITYGNFEKLKESLLFWRKLDVIFIDSCRSFLPLARELSAKMKIDLTRMVFSGEIQDREYLISQLQNELRPFFNRPLSAKTAVNLQIKIVVACKLHESKLPISNVSECEIMLRKWISAKTIQENEIDVILQRLEKRAQAGENINAEVLKEEKIRHAIEKKMRNSKAEFDGDIKDYAILGANWIIKGELTERSFDQFVNRIGEKWDKEGFIKAKEDFLDKIKTVQKTVRVFSSRKKMIVAITRRVNARIRSKTETTLLYEESINSLEKLKYAQHQFKQWDEMSQLMSTMENNVDQSMIEQNRQINTMLDAVLSNMHRNVEIMQQTTFKVIVDKDRNIQAAAVFKLNQKREEKGKEKNIPLYISLISSAPWNLRIDANQEDKRRVEGAATALIERAIQESINTNSGGAVALEAVPPAVNFYEKMGFKRVSWTPEEDNLIPMELSIKDAKAFLASKRAGRSFPELYGRTF